MTASKVMTVRIDPELLDRLRETAKEERRSVSAHVVSLVREQLDEKPRRERPKPLPTWGWLRHLDAPDDVEEFRKVRRALSRRFATRGREHAKAK